MENADNNYSWIASDNLNTYKTFDVGCLEAYMETFKTHSLCFYKRLNYIKFRNIIPKESYLNIHIGYTINMIDVTTNCFLRKPSNLTKVEIG